MAQAAHTGVLITGQGRVKARLADSFRQLALLLQPHLFILLISIVMLHLYAVTSLLNILTQSNRDTK
jgi:hypothetical protein